MLKSLTGGLFLIVLLAFSSNAEAVNTMLTPEAIQGTWVTQEDQNTMRFTFSDNSCTFFHNETEMQGMFRLSGNRLTIQLQNGNSQSYAVALQGVSLILDDEIRLMRQKQQGQQNQQISSSSLDGVWHAEIPQGILSFHFKGNKYVVLMNDEIREEGIFTLTPDGQFTYKVTQGQNQGQTGTNRFFLQDNSFTMNWPDGSSLTFTRSAQGSDSPQTGKQTPVEGRWKWTNHGPISFSYIFSGNSFIFLQNDVEVSTGTLTLNGSQIILRYETGPEAGKIEYLGYQLDDNHLLLIPPEDSDMHSFSLVRY